MRIRHSCRQHLLITSVVASSSLPSSKSLDALLSFNTSQEHSHVMCPPQHEP